MLERTRGPTLVVDNTQTHAKLVSAVKTLIPCAMIAAEMLQAAGEETSAHKILLVVKLSRDFLADAGVPSDV